MNIYKFHSNPDQLKYHAEATERIPEFAWKKYENKTKELRKRESLWSTSAEYSYLYAQHVLRRKRFPAGEPAIATDAEYSYYYAREVLGRSFPHGEAAIAGDAWYSYSYAKYVLKDRFPLGEPTIADDANYFYFYTRSYSEEFNLKIVDGKFVPK